MDAYREAYIDGVKDGQDKKALELYNYFHTLIYEHKGEYQMALEDVCNYIKKTD